MEPTHVVNNKQLIKVTYYCIMEIEISTQQPNHVRYVTCFEPVKTIPIHNPSCY